MANRKRARANNRWPAGTEHYLLFADGKFENLQINDEYTLFRARREIQEGIAYDKANIPSHMYLDDLIVALVHVMPKQS